MLLQRLKEYAEGGLFEMPPSLYSARPIRYLIDLDRDGRLLTPEPVDTSDPSDRQNWRGAIRLAPYLSRSKGIKPLLLADNAHYTLGVSSESMSAGRPEAMHSSYMELIDLCRKATGSAPVQAVHRFLDTGAGGLTLPGDFNTRDAITFRVEGIFPIDLPEVQRFWASAEERSRTTESECLVCGEAGPVLDRLTGKLRGIPRGQLAGTSMISANRPAFESYGLRNSQVAPTCRDCGEKVTEAANQLLGDDSSHIRFAAGKTIIWTRERSAFNWARILDSPDQPHVLEQIGSLGSDDSNPAAKGNPLYCATLSASGGRAALRDWFETTVGSAERNLANWFRDQAIASARHDRPEPLGIHSLLGATVRDLRDVPAVTVTALLRSALLGAAIPVGLLHLAVTRNRVERRVTRPRAALIKMALARRGERTQPGRKMVELDRNDHRPAYMCGRLLSVLESAEVAIAGTRRPVSIDRYFGLASSAPESAFDMLRKRATHHFNTVKHRSVATYRDLKEYAEEILDVLNCYPTALSLEEQGLFALGYYHQKVHLLRQKRGLLSGVLLQLPAHSSPRSDYSSGWPA